MSSNPATTADATAAADNKKREKKKGANKFVAGAADAASADASSSSSDGAAATTAAAVTAAASAAALALPKTPAGHMKNMLLPMADAYHPHQVEEAWDSWWEKQGLYKPHEASPNAEKFIMVIPPPNVTGFLHIGHALTLSIEDALTRWHRMQGHTTLWVPGTDHAGIATQVVVEKQLMREQKLTRHDLGRDKFIDQVWKWKEASGNRICTQIRRLGASVDWSREAFTMDAQLTRAVQAAFLHLHKKKLIYRSNRLVNWSCALRTAISSIEVEFLDLDGPTQLKVPGYDKTVEFGVIHSFAYKVEGDESTEVVVATTRIETMLGDVAVAVHPDDARYKALHGKRLVHPFLPGHTVKVITDPVLVDMNFGTGAVKVTPGHDPNDFACGQRNQLPTINIFTDDGLLNENGGPYAGQKRFVVRERIIEDLTKLGLYRGKAPNKMALGLCSRSKDIVEPVVRPQWWVNCASMAQAACDKVRNGELKIVPSAHEKIWFNWLENIQDWCISRQLWWGHRIPAFHVTIAGRPAVDDDHHWIVAENMDKARELAQQRFADVPASDLRLEQDPDVLDTWFSSGLFPFSVMGWPNATPDLKAFYPGSLLETGHDILFFWVARMVMMGLELTGELPFHTVFLHAMVRDKFGRKMSKSLGNVVDPIDVIHGITLEELHAKLKTGNLDPAEVARACDGQKRDFPDGIAECGADALRFGLLAYSAQGRDINLDIQRVVGYRQFGNKLWQATRFALQNFDASFVPAASLDELSALIVKGDNHSDRWIMSRLNAAVAKAQKSLEEFLFADACTAIYDFWLYDLCDVFLELIKPIVRDVTPEGKASRDSSLAVLYTCLNTGLRLLHPMMPFITEELYHRLPHALITDAACTGDADRAQCGSIMIASYPTPAEFARFASPEAEQAMALFNEIAHSARSTRATLGLTKKRVDMYVVCSNDSVYERVARNHRDIATLSFANKVEAMRPSDVKNIPAGALSSVLSAEIELHVPIKGLVDVGAEIVKMEKQLQRLQESVQAARVRIASPGFEKMAEDQRKRTTDKLASEEEEATKLEASISNFLSMMSEEEKKKYAEEKINSCKTEIARINVSIEKFRATLPADPAKHPKKSLTKIAELEQERAAVETQLAKLTA